jgi:hypothetical protein
MTVFTIDSLGTPLRKFEELRDELIASGRKFDDEALSHLPYEKLALCATGIAGSAICSQTLIRTEKKNRRKRFNIMGDTEFQASRTLLQIEQMGNDTARERIYSYAPKWEDLRSRQQMWFKLNCIINHLDNVTPRIQEALAILKCVREARELPGDFINHQQKRLEGFIQSYVLRDTSFRMRIAEIAFEIKKIMPDAEQKICETELLSGYSCTSDCYAPLI